MKNLIFLIAVLAFISTNAQQIEIRKSFGEVQLYKDNERLKMKEVKALMRDHQAAFEELQKANTNKAFAYIFSIPGGALIGYPIGTAIGGGDPEWVLAGIGAGLVAVSIPFMSGYNKRAKNAAGLYNKAVMNTTSSFQPDVRFSVKANGVRLVIVF